MKLLRTLLIGIALFWMGCNINENIDDCPYNAMLTFRYDGDVHHDIFRDKIDGVTLFVFSNSGQLVKKIELSQAELRAYQGVNLKLDPETYRIVCWGNAFAETQITSENALNAALLQHPNLLLGTQIPTNDHLYYADYTLNLPKNDIITGEIPFSGAHINLEIYTKGTGTATQLPRIEVRNLSAQYDFGMNVMGTPTTYYPIVSYDAAKDAAAATLQTLRFADDNVVEIDIRNPLNTAQTITVVKLKDFMALHNIHVDGIHEATVRVLVEFNDFNIIIKIPDWEDEGITPGGPGYN